MNDAIRAIVAKIKAMDALTIRPELLDSYLKGTGFTHVIMDSPGIDMSFDNQPNPEFFGREPT